MAGQSTDAHAAIPTVDQVHAVVGRMWWFISSQMNRLASSGNPLLLPINKHFLSTYYVPNTAALGTRLWMEQTHIPSLVRLPTIAE